MLPAQHNESDGGAVNVSKWTPEGFCWLFPRHHKIPWKETTLSNKYATAVSISVLVPVEALSIK